MRSHVAKTVSACFAVLRQLYIRSVCRSVPISVLQSLVTSLVLTGLDYGNATLVGIPQYQFNRLQSVMNAGARLVFSASRYDHITPLLRQLHWLKAPRSESSSSLPSLFTSVGSRQRHRTSSKNYASRQTLRLDVVCGQPHHHHWLSAVRGCLSAIVLFRSLPHVFGTVCRRTSRLRPRCLFFAVV